MTRDTLLAEDTMAIQFNPNEKKTIEVITWLVNERPGLDLYTIVKLLYFADKMHLLLYGRPILGDRYIAMEHGMVPSRAYDILESDLRHVTQDTLTEFSSAVQVERGADFPTYYPRRLADERFLSGSDRRCLKEVLESLAGRGFDELWRLAHEERAYQEAWKNKKNSTMSYELIIDEDHPRREELLRELHETAAQVRF